MYEARFKLKHKGCWTGGLIKFKSDFVFHISVSLTENFIQDIIEITLENHEGVSIKKYLFGHKSIKKAEAIFEDDKKLLLQLFTDTSKTGSIIHTILKCKCFLSNKIPIIKGFEVWTIAAAKKSAVDKAVLEIERLGELQLIYIKKSSFDGYNLSSCQEKTIKLAVNLGYFNWPRRITIQELAERLKLSKATVAEHLRKAESKIILREIPNQLG